MKKLVFIAILITFLPRSIYTQQNIFIAGAANVNLSIDTLEKISIKNTGLKFEPEFGFHFHENWVLGFNANLNYEKTLRVVKHDGQSGGLTNETESSVETINQTYGAGLYIRKRQPITDKFAFYTQVFFKLSEKKYHRIRSWRDNDFIEFTKINNYGLQAGLEFKFGKRWFLTTQMKGIYFFHEIPSDNDNAENPARKDFAIELDPRYISFTLNYHLKHTDKVQTLNQKPAPSRKTKNYKLKFF